MKKTIFLLAIGAVCILQLAAQTDVDALRYSQIFPGGTSRSMSMGGAFGALGGDFSCLSMNPAGIALFRKSEFTFSPSLGDLSTNSSYLGSSYNNSKYNFNISNVGLIGHLNLQNSNPEGWQNVDFGIGYNRQNNFNSNITFQGQNNNSSLLDYFLQQVNSSGGTLPSDLSAGNAYFQDASLAYNAYLINPLSGDSTHYNSVLHGAGEIQKMVINTTGSMGEMVLSMGANYAHKLYFGATLGIDFLNYNENSLYSEENQHDTVPGFKNFNINRTLNTYGTGINLKLGMIYRANDFLRIGLAVHTPTFYNMHDDYNATINSSFDTESHTYSNTPGSFDYTLTTPLRVIGSIAVIINKQGVISADYEFVDYSSSQLNSSTYTFTDANSAVQQKYTATSNIRFGTEWNITNIKLRAGYAFYGSPFSSSTTPPNGANLSTNSFSVGIGVKENSLSLDLGYVYSIAKQYYQPYILTSQTVDGATIKSTNNVFVMTIGYKF